MNRLTNTLNAAHEVIQAFCAAHDLPEPRIKEYGPNTRHHHMIDSCGFYRDKVLNVMPAKCAPVSNAEGGLQWSYPGWMIDRTEGGVLFHEFGHYVDHTKSWWLGGMLRKSTREAKISGYCPNAGEWFAEMFRLFMSNPDLLRLTRPKTYKNLAALYPNHPVTDSWERILVAAPARVLRLAEARIKEVYHA